MMLQPCRLSDKLKKGDLIPLKAPQNNYLWPGMYGYTVIVRIIWQCQLHGSCYQNRKTLIKPFCSTHVLLVYCTAQASGTTVHAAQRCTGTNTEHYCTIAQTNTVT